MIPVCEPLLDGNELKYVTEAVTTNWISSSGRYIKDFEEAFAAYCGVEHAIAVTNGTVAIHLALVALGIKAGDEVIIPDFTMMASAVAVCYTGAMPVFVDADATSWNIAVDQIEEKITSRTKAIMAVHIYGTPCDMDAIRALAAKHNLFIIEDAAEAVGAEYKGRKAGDLSDIATFSLFANKNLTTGEGGMVTTNDPSLARECRYYKNVCFSVDGPRNYLHEDIGFNYRMSNLHAAIGLAQVEKADHYRNLRIQNGRLYRSLLAGVPGLKLQALGNDGTPVFWMNSICLTSDYGRTRSELVDHLKANGIETRLLFQGMHRQPALRKYGADCAGRYPVSDDLAENGLYLPSGSGLTHSQIEHVASLVRDFGRGT